MQALIVLGIIPGTNIQIDFFGWLGIFTVLICARYTIRHLRRKHTQRFLRTFASLVLATR